MSNRTPFVEVEGGRAEMAGDSPSLLPSWLAGPTSTGAGMRHVLHDLDVCTRIIKQKIDVEEEKSAERTWSRGGTSRRASPASLVFRRLASVAQHG